MKKACVLLVNGFEEIEALSAVDLLRRAKVYVDTVSVEEEYTVNGAHGINVVTEDLFDEVNFEEFDMIILPGGGPGTKRLEAHAGVKSVLLKAIESEQLIAAICAAPTILGKMGLLKGRQATCYPGLEGDLQGAVLSDKNVVVDGKIITSKGVGTALEFSLKLIEELIDDEKAKEIANEIVY
ncbi:4-methyl-5(b-hydroxyethyl)-thiazole monophosphate biosynthesis [Aequitasia blattaphilus]|uniref:DJ-1/PfpI family protein n=1 Tax=Aequitasia blattaphilus TaxID=2949332 RepID=A0ABT1E6H1_9FIRM|nr:DJ-1 family glyoxalase III [Aequitasia blattaphilus]MCP1101435.1 DJ-1/PfpI family protein [Aequitasia blattaphilus]MCR8614075.1 DJ-1/PfpI family protein [Aequitasia blattaphilus]